MHLRRALALSLAVPLLLAGCTEEEPTPDIPDPTTSSATPTPEETETAEVESAEEFIRRWVDLSNEMQSTGDVGEYVAVSSDCKACMRVADRVEAVYSGGGFIRTRGWSVLKLTDQSGRGDREVWDVRVKSAPTVLKESSDAAPQRLGGGELVFRFRLQAAGEWSLAQLTQVPS